MNKIDDAARKLAQLCIMESIDLTYVDAEGLTVKVTRAPEPKRRKKSQNSR